jgi:hypothetical protein
MASRCPSSGSTGVAVDRQTVKALLTEMALRRLEAGAYRFCPDPYCDVVYFDGHSSCFRNADVRVPVWQKEPFGARMILLLRGIRGVDSNGNRRSHALLGR